MTSTLFFSLEKKNWIAYWNRALVFLFITTYFLGGITRYKHLIVILMTITTIVYLCKRPKHYLSLFKTISEFLNCMQTVFQMFSEIFPLYL